MRRKNGSRACFRQSRAHARRALSWIAWKLTSGLVFLVPAAAWFVILSALFQATGLRARFQGASDFWVFAVAVAFFLLAIPVFILHGWIMKKIRARFGPSPEPANTQEPARGSAAEFPREE
jgi:hypothetical protein